MAWQNSFQDYYGTYFYYIRKVRRFDVAGGALGPAVPVGSGSMRLGIDVRGRSDQSFVVAWSGAIGLEFVVNSYLTGDQDSPSVAVDAAGRFLVAWSSPSAGGVQARVVEAGAPVGLKFEVGTQAGVAPAVAGRGPGDFVVVWQNNGQDASGWGVFAQRFGDLIFSDGFNWDTSGP